MRWEPEVSRGAWIVPRLDRAWGTMHVVVPRGFEAYARVFHPIGVQRPVGLTWDDVRAGGWPDSWERRSTTWAAAAADAGLTWHPLFQWERVRDTDPDRGSWNGVPVSQGWRVDSPEQGRLEPELLASITAVLARHTATPDSGCAAVWEGWGGLFGRGVVRLALVDSADDERGRVVSTTPPAVLGSEVEDGPRLSLPMREHVLFDAGVAEFADASWPTRAPWIAEPELRGESPSLIWPDDLAWVLVSEIDFDSTVVGGTAACIADLLAVPGIEAAEIPEGADLSIVGDRVNPRS
ncbi:hypothetical protein [Agromyces larvae]|uniref:DUF2716 domain-containing protein n=1 Tax=Agromyces larvae TaxID=2929802 RepID=A0ABY4BYK2_9MICO|nr:hypothetical protein [Agromyces larvae]UOE42946.1 hypothetical protein MTO99_12190 [Agromyces larvae]